MLIICNMNMSMNMSMNIQGLTVKELEELHDDIKMHLDMDRATQTHTEYWEVMFSCLLS